MGIAALTACLEWRRACSVQSCIVETFMAFSAREGIGVTMTEEATDAPAASEEAPASVEQKAPKHANLEKKFRTITGEEILRHTRPSFMAFFGYYLLAVFMMGVHWLFFNDNLAGLLTNEDSSNLSTFIFELLANDLTFMAVMLSLTWFNRMLNASTSNRWLTVWMLLTSIAPLLVVLDNWLTGLLGDGYPSIGSDGGLLPEYNYLIAGAFFSGALVVLTALYQRSFHYAVTSDAVIFDHRFLLVRGHRRILFEKISEVLVERTMLGTMLGFATISLLTDSGIGLAQETRGVAAASPTPEVVQSNEDDTNAEKAGKSVIRRILGLITYQRTVTTVSPDPKLCFFNVRGWQDTKQLLNELHKKHSQSSQLDELKAALTQD